MSKSRRTLAARTTLAIGRADACFVPVAVADVRDEGDGRGGQEEEDKRLSGLQLRMKGLEDVRHEEAEDRRPPASGCVLMDVQAIECHAATSCCSACGENVEASAHPFSSLQAHAIRIDCPACGKRFFSSKGSYVTNLEGKATRMEAARVKLVYDTFLWHWDLFLEHLLRLGRGKK